MQEAAPQGIEIAGDDAVDDVQTGPRWWWLNERVDAPATGKPAELVIPETDDDETEPKDRDRAASESEKANDEVRRPPAVERRPHTRRHSDEHRDEQRGEGQLERRGERIDEVVDDGASRSDAPAKVPVKDARRVGHVLLDQRSVEPVLGAEGGDLVVRRVIAKSSGSRVRGDDVRDRERDDRDSDHHGRDPDDAPYQVTEESHGAPGAYLVIEAKSNHPIGFHAKPFTFDRRPNSSVG